MKVKVQQHHIDAASHNSISHDPICLAATQAGLETVEVYGDSIRFYRGDVCHDRELPAEAVELLVRFEAGEVATPIEFDLVP